MGRKTPAHKSNPKITEAKFKSIIVSALRNASRWWQPAQEAKKDACVGVIINKKTGKKAKHYKCIHCNNVFVEQDIRMDHINPVISPLDGFVSWDIYIDRLFAPKEGYQCLCNKCHDTKTQKEKELKKKHEKRNAI